VPIELNHKTLSEAINFHETWFEYHINMGHLAVRNISVITPSAEKEFTRAAMHANILRELRFQQAVSYQDHADKLMGA